MNRYIKLILAALVAMPALAMEAPKERINTVKPSKRVTLDSKGHFSNDESLKTFLEEAANQNKAPKSFVKIKEARSLAKEAKEAKYATEQLYLIKSANDNSYIIKEIKYDKDPMGEIKRLEIARAAPQLKQYVYPKITDNVTIVLPNRYITYSDGKRNHYLVVMANAEGKPFQNIMEQYRSKPDTATIELACQAYYDLGAAMAKFYKRHGSLLHTIRHGDFHHANAFYNKNNRLVSLIDNERIAESLAKPTDISSDLGFLFVTSPFVIEWSHPGFIKGMDLKRWYQIIIPSFILGFIRTYPSNERRAIFETLKTLLLKWNTKVKPDDSREVRGIIKEIVLELERQLIDEHKTELHIAAGNCDLTKLVEIMIGEGTKAMNEQDKFGNIPLHEAAYFGCKRSAKLLLKAGSALNKHNAKGETPLFKAHYNKQKELETLLKKHGGK